MLLENAMICKAPAYPPEQPIADSTALLVQQKGPPAPLMCLCRLQNRHVESAFDGMVKKTDLLQGPGQSALQAVPAMLGAAADGAAVQGGSDCGGCPDQANIRCHPQPAGQHAKPFQAIS